MNADPNTLKWTRTTAQGAALVLRKLRKARWTKQTERMGPAAAAQVQTYAADGEPVIRITAGLEAAPYVEVRAV